MRVKTFFSVTRVLALLLVTCLWASAAHAQDDASSKRELSGIVKDENGEGMIGATVQIKGTSKGAKTDIDGKFTIVVEPTDVLIVSFIGYKKQEIPVGDQENITIRMQVEARAADEVVVIGYGIQKKDDLTGAINPVAEKDFNKGIINTPTELLSGKAPGIQLIPSTGEPGASSSMRIRGGSSLSASNEPLYVIDGLPIDNGSSTTFGDKSNQNVEINTINSNPLASINPNDIESIVVLKDASSTAIYGSRGANGVIIITTKKGAKGGGLDAKMIGSVSYDGYVGFSTLTNKYGVLSPSEWAEEAEKKIRKDAIESNYQKDIDYLVDSLVGKVEDLVDFQDAIFQVGTSHAHNLAVTGGIGNFSYRASGSYLNQQGIIKMSGFERLSGRVNLDHSFFYDENIKQDRVSMSANFSTLYTKNSGIAQSQNNGYEGGLLTQTLRLSPATPVYNKDGGFNYLEPIQYRNPIAMLNEIEDVAERTRNYGGIFASYRIHGINDLTANVRLGYDVNSSSRKVFYPKKNKDFLGGAGRLVREDVSRLSKTLEAYLNYNKDFGFLTLDVLAGYSYSEYLTSTLRPSVSGLSTDATGVESFSGESQIWENIKEENRLASFYGRFNLSILDKYLITATVRADGSSRFSPDNRWGVFPSGAIAWRITSEPFMEDAREVLSNLKLRASVGVVGNQEIGNYRYIPNYDIIEGNKRLVIDGREYIQFEEVYVNPSLKWEETFDFNVGLEYGFLSNRFFGGIDFYYRVTSDLLLEVSPVHPAPAETIIDNVGALRNMGLEFSFNGYLIDIPDVVSWNLGITATYQDIVITKLDQEDAKIETGIVSGGGATGISVQRMIQGEAPYSFWGYVEANDASKRPGAGRPIGPDGKALGDGAEKTVLGKPLPDVILGISSFLQVYDFDLSFSLRANVGNSLFNNTEAELSDKEKLGVENITRYALNNNTVGTSYESSRWVQDASFLRMDNLTLGYNFKYDNFRLRAYFTIQNVFVATSYSGYDPEVDKEAKKSINGVGSLGIDYMSYPKARTFILGVNITL